MSHLGSQGQGNDRGHYNQYDKKRKDSAHHKGQQQQVKYVKKEAKNQPPTENQKAPEQKSDPLEGWLLNQIRQDCSKGTKKSISKETLLSRFKPLSEINFSLYNTQVLDWAEIFSNSQEPEASQNSALSMAQVQKNVVSKPQFLGRGGPTRARPGFGRERLEEEQEEDEDPEWIDFDPKKEAVKNFFGREIPNESELRQQVKASRELEEEKRKGSGYHINEDDEFEKMIEEEESKKKDNDWESQVENLANEIMKSKNSYSDIDLIVEKKVKQKQGKQEGLDDEQMDQLFGSLKQKEEEKKQPKEEVKEEAPPIYNENLSKQLAQQIEFLSQQQQEKLKQQKIIQEKKPQFTALQNLEKLFQNYSVVAHEKHRIKLEQIQQTEYQGHELFQSMMASINPFSTYILQELQEGKEDPDEKGPWELEESIFQKPAGGVVNQETLRKTSAQMFKIYKFCSNPHIRVKSQKYTNDQFVYIKDLFPSDNLLWTPPLNLQLQQNSPQGFPSAYPPMPGYPQMVPQYPQPALQQTLANSGPQTNLQGNAQGYPQGNFQGNAQGNSQPSLQPNLQGNPAPQTQIFPQMLAQMNQQEKEAEGQGEEEYGEEEEGYKQNDLMDMESQLKSILGFQLK